VQETRHLRPFSNHCYYYYDNNLKFITACYQGGITWFHVYYQRSSGRPNFTPAPASRARASFGGLLARPIWH
jgi:hypothetical protein